MIEIPLMDVRKSVVDDEKEKEKPNKLKYRYTRSIL